MTISLRLRFVRRLAAQMDIFRRARLAHARRLREEALRLVAKAKDRRDSRALHAALAQAKAATTAQLRAEVLR